MKNEKNLFNSYFYQPYFIINTVNPFNFAAINFCDFNGSKFHCLKNLLFSSYVIMMSKIFTNINFRDFITIVKFAKINRTRNFPVLLGYALVLRALPGFICPMFEILLVTETPVF